MAYRAAAAVAVVLLLLQGTAAIRPIDSHVSIGRNLTNIAPGCKQDCCYDPQWWLNTRPAPIVTCIDGTDTDLTADYLTQACDQGTFPDYQTCTTGPTGASLCGDRTFAGCQFTEYPGIHASEDDLPCWLTQWQGQWFEVYNPLNVRDNNNEIIWACADAPQGGPAGVTACGEPNVETYNNGASYGSTWGWNIGVAPKLDAKIFDVFTAGLTFTAQYTRTNTATTTSSVTVTANPGQHACVAKGTLVHHAWGSMVIDSGDQQIGNCKKWKIDNFAVDLPINDPNVPDWATAQEWGSDVKPCGYPLLNGAL